MLAIERYNVKNLTGRFDRYDNPFEKKWVYKYKDHYDSLFDQLEAWMIDTYPIIHVDPYRHWHGLFVYEPGDYLKVHVDAGIHPIFFKQDMLMLKYMTVLYYLTEADIEFWGGNSCTDEHPHLLGPGWCYLLHIPANTLVAFENDDFAWHGVLQNKSDQLRIVATVSGLTSLSTNLNHTNQRQRAYFVPRPDEDWTPEMYELRDKRADSEHYAEVYRTS